MKSKMPRYGKFLITPLLLLLATAHKGSAKPLDFDFRDPKATSVISITIDSAWEPITGSATGITGNVQFDPANPKATTGKIEVAVSSIEFPNKGYGFTARGAYGLNGEKYPTISFQMKRVRSLTQTKPGVFKATVDAEFTCRGITKPLIIPVTAAYLPGKAGPRGGGVEGDLLTVRTNFFVHRDDYKIAQGVEEELVSQNVEVRVAIVGIRYTTPTQPEKKPTPKTETVSKKTVSVFTDLKLEGKDYSGSVMDRMKFHQVPGISVAILRKYKVAEIKHFGVTSSLNEKAVEDTSLFEAGNQGSAFLPTLIFQRVREGKLDLDTDINRYLKSWKVPESALNVRHPVTLRHLLAHRSGFVYHKYYGYSPDKPVPTLTQVLKGEAPSQTPATKVETVPGTKFNLASENYVVLQQILEDVTGKPYAQLVREKIFTPLGMKHSAFDLQDKIGDFGLPVSGHEDAGKPMEKLPVYPETAASGLWTTAQDFALFLGDILHAYKGDKDCLLTPIEAKMMFAPIATEHSMGFGRYEQSKSAYLYWGGNAQGFYSNLTANLDTGDGIVVLMNRNLCWQFYNEIRDALGKKEGWNGF